MLDNTKIYTTLDPEIIPFNMSEAEYDDSKEYLKIARIAGTLYALTQVLFLGLDKNSAYNCELLTIDTLYNTTRNWAALCRGISCLSIAAAVVMFFLAVLYIVGGRLFVLRSAYKLGVSKEQLQPNPNSEDELKAEDKMYVTCELISAKCAWAIQVFSLPIIGCLHLFAAVIFCAITGESSYLGLFVAAIGMTLVAHFLCGSRLMELDNRHFYEYLYFSSHIFKMSQYKKFGLDLTEEEQETIDVCQFLEKQGEKKNAEKQNKFSKNKEE